METTTTRLARLKASETITPDEMQWLFALAEKAEEYENILGAIANIDTIFIENDGSERPFNETEALRVIDELVQPVWEATCTRMRKENQEKYKF